MPVDSSTLESVLGPELDAILGPEEEQEEQEQQEDGDEIDLSEAEEGDEAAEDDAEQGDDEEEAETPAVEAPHSWSKEDKALFAQLPPEAQAVIQRRETERDNFVKQKAFEASQTRNQVATEARDIIAKLHDDHVQKLTIYAQQIMPQAPDERLLYTGNQEDVTLYNRQMAAYQRSADQQRELHQQIAQSQAAAQSAREQSQQAERASDAQRLQEQLPEWFDPSSGPKLREQLQSIGAELGYPDELMAEASSTDILALKKALEWKADAEKYRKAMAKQMETVRAAKGLPKMVRPGTKPSKQQLNAANSQKAWDRVKSNPKDGTAIADWLGL
ncbi:hypothetical protein [Sphingobium sp. EP60837]|uniref:hypothetical protein n=1 Tax=Sphingobium sp. EP60837 TaxID=1855519 RepID=UPI0007DD32C5|nr:hypothetical protein [Sphingobium sp. EP60837]ANI79015.1 hypothetical protein EP837_02620 [Sphingobium sp. EP60837]